MLNPEQHKHLYDLTDDGQNYIAGLVATYEHAWADQWRMQWRQGIYTPWPDFFMRKLDEAVMIECDLLRGALC